MIWRRDDAEHEEPQDATQPREAAMTEQASTEVTIVGQGAKLEGTVVSAGSLRIDGQVKGQINADGDVILSPQSQVEADIRAVNVTVAGRFKGNVFAKQTAELSRGGRVDGNITSKSLIVSEGAVFNGQSTMDSQKPEGGQAASAASAAQTAPPAQPQPAEAGKR
ncbi:MAG: polymer-forming cytoskeletal protein [Actinomycetota bacterium]